MEPLTHSWVESPIGPLLLVRSGAGLQGIRFPSDDRAAEAPAESRRDDSAFADVREQLTSYFTGDRRTFDLGLDLRGTEFQLRVWRALLAIPYGRTTTYGALAAAIGRPNAIRAVGAANGANPIPIVVPCHRVIGAGGSLTGFGGGLPAKRFLLDLETYGGTLAR